MTNEPRRLATHVSILCGLLLHALGCGEPQGGDLGAADRGDSTRAEVAWLGRSALLLRGDYPRRDWIVAREAGGTLALDGLPPDAPLLPSPQGAHLLTRSADPDLLYVMSVSDLMRGDQDRARVPMPPFPPMGLDETLDNVTFAFWLSDGRALIARINPDIDYAQCYVYTPGESAMRESPACLAGAGLAGTGVATRATSLGGDHYALYSADEGTVYVSLVRFTPEAGVIELTQRFVYPFICIVDIYRDPAADVVYLASREPLAADGTYARPITDFPPAAAQVLYRIGAKGRVAATDLRIPPRGVLRSIASGDVAWIEPTTGQVCTQSPAADAVCHALPNEVRLDPAQAD